MMEICVSCHRLGPIKARKLCNSCWIYARKSGHLEAYPTRDQRLNSKTRCTCFQPIEEPIPPWGVQCLKCKRAIIT